MYSFKHEHKLAIKDRAPETREAILFADIKTKCEDTERAVCHCGLGNPRPTERSVNQGINGSAANIARIKNVFQQFML